jgi:hypothetical protein
MQQILSTTKGTKAHEGNTLPFFARSVFAEFGVEALVCEAESFDWLIVDNMGIDDFIHLGFGNVAVPDGLGIHDDRRSVLALIEASGLVGADTALESAFGEFLFEELLQSGFSCGVAASAGIRRRALISADEDVLLKFRHVPSWYRSTQPPREPSFTKEWGSLLLITLAR